MKKPFLLSVCWISIYIAVLPGADTTPTTLVADTTPTTSGADTTPTTSEADTTTTTSGADTTSTTSGADTTTTTSGADTTTTMLKADTTTTISVPFADAPVTGGYKPNLANFVIKLNFEISIELSFKKEFEDPSSIEYINLQQKFLEKLKPLYEKLEGFKTLKILRLRNGSTVALYQVDVAASSSDVTKEKLENVSAEIKNLIIDGHNVTESIDDDIENALANMTDKCNAEGICSNRLICKGGQTGSPYCVCEDNNCKNDGICHAVANDNYICSCKTTDDYVYSGEHCELSTRKSPLSEDGIIFVAGLGGGVLVLVISIFGCVCCARNRKRRKRDSQSDAADQPQRSLPHLDKMRMSNVAQGNDYNGKGMPNYGFEPEQTDMRYHRRFQHGKEQDSCFAREDMDHSPKGSKNTRRDMYNGETSENIYDELYALDNPESRLTDSRRASQMRPRGNDPNYQRLNRSIREGERVYQHIDTEGPYSIKRPNFR